MSKRKSLSTPGEERREGRTWCVSGAVWHAADTNSRLARTGMARCPLDRSAASEAGSEHRARCPSGCDRTVDRFGPGCWSRHRATGETSGRRRRSESGPRRAGRILPLAVAVPYLRATDTSAYGTLYLWLEQHCADALRRLSHLRPDARAASSPTMSDTQRNCSEASWYSNSSGAGVFLSGVPGSAGARVSLSAVRLWGRKENQR